MLDVHDTIAAIASAPGGAARGIVRLSGPDVLACVRPWFTPREVSVDLSTLVHATRVPGRWALARPLGDVPCDLYLWPTTRSYTRQPSAELHLPGSPPLLQAALARLGESGARLAARGEFTLRAFLAGRLDLTQAEAVLGVIEATGQRELEVALAQLAGGLARPLDALRNALLDLLAHLEAGLDFVEEDIEFIAADELTRQLAAIGAQLEQIERTMVARQVDTATLRVVLTGPPNAGKSSLLNALAGEEAALVASTAGTTRDYITREIDLDGFPCQLTDTAGLAGATAVPDAEGERQARRLAGEAHVVLLCRDATLAAPVMAVPQNMPAQRVIPVATKIDLLPPNGPSAGGCLGEEEVATSARTGTGLAELRARIGRELRRLSGESEGAVANTAARCHESLRAAREGVERACALAETGQGEELVAAELHAALDDLGRVVGAVYTDDVLDRIFSRFCIGK
jgi:tRNA modification GTPase